MASAFSHAIASVAIGRLSRPLLYSWRYWLAGIFCAVVPDADAVGFCMGVPYDSLWGHRGITHSFFFSLLLAGAVMVVLYKRERLFSRDWWLLFLSFFLSTASHPLLDACTNGGLGVAFFAPFDDTRYFLPWRVIQVSPIGVSAFFSQWGLAVLRSEFVYVWLPLLVVIGLVYLLRRGNINL